MVKVFRDGRTVYSGKDYTAFKKAKWEAQGKCCADCGMYLPFEYAEFHHYGTRGMAGWKRNDLEPRNRILCSGPTGCHEKARFEHLKPKEAFDKKVSSIVEWAEGK